MPRTKLYYLITEVSDMLDIPPSTLRFWERVIPQLKPTRSKGGQRRYRQSDIDLIRRIKTLLHDNGMRIEAVSAFLKNSAPPKQFPSCKSNADALNILALLHSIVQDNPKALLLIESLSTFLKNQPDSS